jgi:hypothetical protein
MYDTYTIHQHGYSDKYSYQLPVKSPTVTRPNWSTQIDPFPTIEALQLYTHAVQTAVANPTA